MVLNGLIVYWINIEFLYVVLLFKVYVCTDYGIGFEVKWY